jgi:hypothetical protein
MSANVDDHGYVVNVVMVLLAYFLYDDSSGDLLGPGHLQLGLNFPWGVGGVDAGGVSACQPDAHPRGKVVQICMFSCGGYER